MQISYEYIVEQDPYVIFVLERSTAISTNDRNSNASSFDKNPLIHEITAFQNNQIHYLTPNSWYLSNVVFKLTNK